VKSAWRIGIISKGLRIALLLFLVAGISGCSGLLFYPATDWVRTPEQLGVEYRDIELASDDGTRLSAWWLETPGKALGTVVFLHGNAENISTHLGSVYWLPEAGYQVLLLDYRGYGHSQGTPILPEIFDDIAASIDWVRQEPDAQQKPVFVLGQSLGASMAGYVVATRSELRADLSGVVLDAGFASYAETAREVASRHWLTWLFQYPVAWSMPDNFDLIDHIGAISPVPLLIVHGTQDEVIPFSNGERLFEAAVEPKAFLRYDGPHIDTFRDLGNRELLLDFFERAAAQPPGDTKWLVPE
jgi:fermentation-respiration switch protein FrsA (DUF1100 family)